MFGGCYERSTRYLGSTGSPVCFVRRRKDGRQRNQPSTSVSAEIAEIFHNYKNGCHIPLRLVLHLTTSHNISQPFMC